MNRGLAVGTKRIRGALTAAIFWLAAGANPSTQAQALRDPTVAPAGVAGAAHPGASAAGRSDGKPLSVMVVDGRAFVVSGSRLYAQGGKLGSATIERISETQIWLRDGKELRKVNLYSGVQRLPHVPAKTEPRCDLEQAAVSIESSVDSRANVNKKSAISRGGAPVPRTAPACKSAAP